MLALIRTILLTIRRHRDPALGLSWRASWRGARGSR